MGIARWIRRFVAGPALLGLVILAAAACGGGDGDGSGDATTSAPGTTSGETTTASSEPAEETEPPSEAGSLTGTWDGTWESTSHPGSAGTFQIQWAQTGQNVVGTITITGTPCISEGAISGALDGDQIAFGAIQGGQAIAYQGTASADSMSGTYQAPTCDNGEGTWEASRTS